MEGVLGVKKGQGHGNRVKRIQENKELILWSHGLSLISVQTTSVQRTI